MHCTARSQADSEGIGEGKRQGTLEEEDKQGELLLQRALPPLGSIHSFIQVNTDVPAVCSMHSALA